MQGSNDGVLTPMGGMNIQMHPRVSQHYRCLPLKSSNSGWHRNWFYILDNASAALSAFFGAP